MKCFGYALSQNKDNVDGLEKNLKAIVPHAFGKHNKCDSSWCGFLKSPTTYKHKSLPRGKDLTGEKLEEDLNAVVDIFVQNSEKLAPLGSSQSNEALNNTIGSKAPKIRHYGGSQSNDFRVACAVSQKNVGYSYVAKVSISFKWPHICDYIKENNIIAYSATTRTEATNGTIFLLLFLQNILSIYPLKT